MVVYDIAGDERSRLEVLIQPLCDWVCIGQIRLAQRSWRSHVVLLRRRCGSKDNNGRLARPTSGPTVEVLVEFLPALP